MSPMYYWQSIDEPAETLQLVGNRAGLALKWKKNIGKIQLYNQSEGYAAGTGPIFMDGKIYYLMWTGGGAPRLVSLDAKTGELNSEYQLPEALPCLECMIKEPDGKYLLPLRYKTALFSHYLLRIDPESHRSLLLPDRYPELAWFYRKGQIIWAGPSPFRYMFVASQDLESGKKNWEVQPFALSLHHGTDKERMILDSDQVILHQEILSSLSAEKTLGIAILDINDGHILWSRKFKGGDTRFGKEYDLDGRQIQSPWLRFGVDETNVYIFRGAYLTERKEWTGRLSVLDRKTGEHAWEKEDILDAFSPEFSSTLPLLYIVKAKEPDLNVLRGYK